MAYHVKTSLKLLSDGPQRVKVRQAVPNPPGGGLYRKNFRGLNVNWEQAAWLAKDL